LADDNLSFDDNITVSMDSQVFNFDSDQDTNVRAPPVNVGIGGQSAAREDLISATSVMGNLAGLELMSADFNFNNFTGHYPAPTPAVYAAPDPRQQLVSPISDDGELDVSHNAARLMSFEEVPQMPVEEDKRRRNTTASARSRVKKKQKTQAVEESVKANREKVEVLEGRVKELEAENTWLKDLILEKNKTNQNTSRLLGEAGSEQRAATEVESEPVAEGSTL